MTRLKRFQIKNAMLIANGVSNLVGILVVHLLRSDQTYLFSRGRDLCRVRHLPDQHPSQADRHALRLQSDPVFFDSDIPLAGHPIRQRGRGHPAGVEGGPRDAASAAYLEPGLRAGGVPESVPLKELPATRVKGKSQSIRIFSL